jgi:hypothetical protein
MSMYNGHCPANMDNVHEIAKKYFIHGQLSMKRTRPEKNVYLFSRYLVRNFPKFTHKKNKENKKLIKNSTP